MPKKIRGEDGPIETPAVATIRELETDLRVRLRIDVSQMLEDGGVDGQTGEPSPEQLQAYVLATIERVLQVRAYILAVSVDSLDLEYQIRALDAERIWVDEHHADVFVQVGRVGHTARPVRSITC